MSHGPARAPHPALSSETLAIFFRRFAVLFGAQTEQDQALWYLEYVQALLNESPAEGDRRLGRRFPARSRGELLEQATWNPAQITGPFQSFVGDVLGTMDACFLLTERITARKDGRSDGVASHFSSAHGGVVQGHLGQFLVYQTTQGSAVVDARLDASEGSGRLKHGRFLEMLQPARARLPAQLVMAPRSIGDDWELLVKLRSQGFHYLVEISDSTSVFAPDPSGSTGSGKVTRGRRPLRNQDLLLTTAAGAARSLSLAAAMGGAETEPQIRESRLAVFESHASTVGAPATLLVIPRPSSGTLRYFLTSLPIDLSVAATALIETRLDQPVSLLSAPPSMSAIDRYEVASRLGWSRHATLVMLGAFWREYCALDQGGEARAESGEGGRLLAIRGGLTKRESSIAIPQGLNTRSDNAPRRSSGWLLGIGVIALLAIILGIWGAVIARDIPNLGLTDLIRVSMFYHPPNDGTSLGALAQRARHVIFTRGDESYLAQMRDRGFSGAALQYLVANEASGPERARAAADRCTEYVPTGNDVTGIAQDFCASLHGDERNFMHNRRGERLYTTLSYQENGSNRTRYYYLMNPGAPGWRDYFAQKALQNVNELPYKGIFLDNIDITLARAAENETNSNGVPAEYANDRVYREAVRGYLESLRARLGRTPIWANLTEGTNVADEYDAYLPYLDGVMNEYFVTLSGDRTVGPNQWSGQMQSAEAVLAQGKSFLAVSQGPKADTNRMRFALASYLMIAGKNSYFRYADGERYDQAWYYDEYENRLGSPLGLRYQSGGLWHREFTCGSAIVDVERRSGDIMLRTSDPKCLVEKIALPLGFGERR